jgi:hypothetical protein
VSEEKATAEPGGTQECPFCISEIPAEAVRCRFCAADVRRLGKRPPDTAAFWVGGVLLALVGLGIAAAAGSDSAWFGFVLLGIGGVLLQIATVASGVSIGLRDRDERRHVARYHNAWENGVPR